VDFFDALAKYLDEQKVKSVYFLGADYQAGCEKLGAAVKFYKGKTFGPVYTPWQTQVDLAAELTQLSAANPQAVVVFYPGGAGIAFVRQFAQAGLKSRIKVYSDASLSNDTNFSAEDGAAVGITETTNWNDDLDNQANKEFVAAYEKAYHRTPTFFAAMQYDTVNLIDSAVKAVHGRIGDKNAFLAALRRADFASVRGPFEFDNDQYPIQDIYLTEVVKEKDGSLRLASRGIAIKGWRNPFHQQCPMKW
jgi:branched-chain amino acid transport system substrate-binding protein